VSVCELEGIEGSRYILVKILTKKGVTYSCLITNVYNKSADKLFDFYNKRQTIEAFFKTCKNTYNIKNLRTSNFFGIYGFLIIVLITHNMIISMKKTCFKNTEVENMGMTAIHKRLGHIMADVVQKDSNFEVVIPPLNNLIKIVIEKLRYKNQQISIYMIDKQLVYC
jgi:hypothetical protein